MTECHAGHTTGLSPDEIYLLNERTIAADRQVLNAYRGVEFSLRCMVKFAAEHTLSLDNDFVTKTSIIESQRQAEVRLSAFEEVVTWVRVQDILPDVGGRPPRLQNKHLCRMCAEPCNADEMIVLDRRFLKSLHPQLGRDGTDPAARLDGLAFCKNCFKVIQDKIDSVAEKNGISHMIRWEAGHTHLSLQALLALGKNKSRVRGGS